MTAKKHRLLKWSLQTSEHGIYLAHPVVLRHGTFDATSQEISADEFLEGTDSIPLARRNQYIYLPSYLHLLNGDSPLFSAIRGVYQCYTLQFKDSTGNPCLRQQVLSMLPAAEQQEDTWDFVSYDEHPSNWDALYFLHPCQTQDILKLLQKDCSQTSTLLLSWLSLILPTIGYTLPSMVFKKLRKQFLQSYNSTFNCSSSGSSS
jgi:hypothetical protein